MNVRRAHEYDAPSFKHLLSRSSWLFASFGDEDLPLYLAGRDRCYAWLAEEGNKPLGFLALSIRRTGWAEVRGLTLTQASAGTVQTLISAARDTVVARGLRWMMCVATAAWLPRLLTVVGFKTVDRIVTYEQMLHDFIPSYPADEHDTCCIAPTGGHALEAILKIDAAAFEAMWQMERREMLTYILTASHTAVAQYDHQVVGYAITHVHGREGQIVRLAVHPHYQGRGFGRKLLLDALRYCRMKGVQRATLNTQESNDISQRLYRSVAFRPVGKPVPVLTGEF